jgi:tRNA threonylcarbamoyladenosine biosynthesis protein TsaB
MRILSIDTASTTGSVAVVDGETLLAEFTIARQETHSRRLMNMIDDALGMAGLGLKEIDGLAFTRGPGSFTGLRIGLSVVKGLAFVSGAPLVGVSSLEVLAHQAPDRSRLVCPMMDARNKEVYCGGYRFSEGGFRLVIDETAVSPEAAADGITEDCLLIGDGAHRYKSLFEERIGPHVEFATPDDGIPRALTVARLSRPRFEAGQIDDVRSVVPVYLRKSYAEKPRAGKAKSGSSEERKSRGS